VLPPAALERTVGPGRLVERVELGHHLVGEREIEDLAFSSIRSRCVDFGITGRSRCRHQRRST
jgi:hypothetical protein